MTCIYRLPMLTITSFFFFNDTATTEIYTLSLHDALPICLRRGFPQGVQGPQPLGLCGPGDRKSTRLNSSHQIISYAVFCLKKKKETVQDANQPQLPGSRPHSDASSPRIVLTLYPPGAQPV